MPLAPSSHEGGWKGWVLPPSAHAKLGASHYLPTQALVAELGAGRCRWAELARRMGTRTGKQCREACTPPASHPYLYLRPRPEPQITSIRALYPSCILRLPLPPLSPPLALTFALTSSRTHTLPRPAVAQSSLACGGQE